MYVAPSILSADFGRLNEEIEAICKAGADLVHVDVMDGHFVPNLTIGPLVVNAVAKVATKPLDVHLMVQNNSFFVDLFLPLKPKFITFHIEEEKHPLRLIDHIRKNGVSPGIVLNPHTPIYTLEYLIKEVDMVLLMSVNPGFGGQKFIPSVIEKTRQVRELIDKTDAKCLIEIDGGVNGLNAADLEEAGADILVAGSYIFGSNSYEESIRALKLQF
ncbi:MAG: ribulose-phosphate 3-epimerase [Campylobacter sp.]|nr:ribulose-phosphate 3-epimerase [Campylobacter sp.]